MACFWSNLHYIAHSSTRGFWTLTHAHGLMKGQEWLKLMEIVNCGKRNPNHVNILNFDLFRALCTCTTRTRTHTDGKFWNAQNDLKRALHWLDLDLSNFKFWRARTCASWRARGQGLSVCWLIIWSLCVLNLVNLWWTDMKISLIMWKHKMAPGWHHGWVITLKSFACGVLILTKIL